MALSDMLEPFVWGAGGARKTPEQIARVEESHTGRFLAEVLGEGRAARMAG